MPSKAIGDRATQFRPSASKQCGILCRAGTAYRAPTKSKSSSRSRKYWRRFSAIILVHSKKCRVLSCSTRHFFVNCCARKIPGALGYCTVTDTVAVCVVKPADVPVTVSMYVPLGVPPDPEPLQPERTAKTSRAPASARRVRRRCSEASSRMIMKTSMMGATILIEPIG